MLVVPTANVVELAGRRADADQRRPRRQRPRHRRQHDDLNFTGHPAVSVPLGYDAFGVPFGLQIVAPRFADGLALGLAQVLGVRPGPRWHGLRAVRGRRLARRIFDPFPVL